MLSIPKYPEQYAQHFPAIFYLLCCASQHHVHAMVSSHACFVGLVGISDVFAIHSPRFLRWVMQGAGITSTMCENQPPTRNDPTGVPSEFESKIKFLMFVYYDYLRDH